MRKLAYYGTLCAAALMMCVSVPAAHAALSPDQEKEILTNCTTDQTGRGKSQADASKACTCTVDKMKKAFTDDQMLLILAGLKGDKDAGQKLAAKNGMDWVNSTIKDIDTKGGEIDTQCGTK